MVGWATKTGQRRIHKERSQPAHRRKKGFLEKHKDYVKRARDYNRKQDKLADLREKAATRNPDEFHFGMINSVVDRDTGCVLKSKKKQSHPQRVIFDYNTQDLGYLRTQKAHIVQKLKKLRADAQVSSESTKTIFVYGETKDEEMKQVLQQNDGHGRRALQINEDRLDAEDAVQGTVDQGSLDLIEKLRVNREQQIEKSEQLLQLLTKQIETMEFRRNMMQKGPRRLEKQHYDVFGDVDKSKNPVYKWKKVRKR